MSSPATFKFTARSHIFSSIIGGSRQVVRKKAGATSRSKARSTRRFVEGFRLGGYGFGLRFLVPFVNQFRFDFGFGESGKSFKVHIGAFTKAVAQRFRVR